MSALTLQQAFSLAFEYHQTGRLAEAEPLYRQILAVDPRHADSLHLLGVLAIQTGHPGVALELIHQALVLSPQAAIYHCNYGSALKDLGRRDEAMASFRHAIALDPHYAGAHNNLGVEHEARRELAAAERCFREAIRCQPAYSEAHNNLGNVLRNTARAAESIDHYHRAIALNPGFADARTNLGVALGDLGQYDAAEAEFHRALSIKPHSPEAHFNLANTRRERGRFAEAAEGYRHTLRLNPRMASAHNNLANLLKEWGSVSEAIVHYRAAVECGGDCYAASNVLLAMHYLDEALPAEIFAAHREWAARYSPAPAELLPPPSRSHEPARRLRVGFVSPDFRGHSVACFLIGFLEQHDPAQVEIFCYYAGPRSDIITERLRGMVPHWREIHGLSDSAAAALIRADAVDILVDLAGHTADHRLGVFARRPAPIQATWIGYCDTTGIPAIDYRLTDHLADPPGLTEAFHVERLIRVPGGAWCYRILEDAPPIGPLPADTAGHITFGCFNALPKLTVSQLRVWAEILRSVPGSRLLLKSPFLQDAPAQQILAAKLAIAGLPHDRVEMLGHRPSLATHLATYDRIDIALDTFPYHGVTTTCEALWMGVPVIVQEGNTHVSRVGVSLLHQAGLPDCIGVDSGHYIQRALDLARDLPRLAELRRTLREKLVASPLTDASRAAREVESAFRHMWLTHCEQQGG